MRKGFRIILVVLCVGACIVIGIFILNTTINTEGTMINRSDIMGDSSATANNTSKGEREDYYVLNFDDSRMCFDEIKPDSKFYNKIPQNAIANKFNDSLSWSRIERIHFTLYTPTTAKVNLDEKLQKADIAKQGIIEKIESLAKSKSIDYFSKPKITDLFVLGKDLFLVKGTYLYMDTVSDPGYELAYFGIFSTKQNKVLLEDNIEFMRAILINGKYYLVTHFQKPEACQDGVVIFRLDGNILATAFDIWGSK